MEKFSIKAEKQNHITIELTKIFGFPEKTGHTGGYDAYVSINIKSGSFYLNSSYFTSTGEIFLFYQQLKVVNEKVRGLATYSSYEDNLNLNIEYDKMGHVTVRRSYQDNNYDRNKLDFEFETDQTFISQTIEELRVLVDKYGGMRGVLK